MNTRRMCFVGVIALVGCKDSSELREISGHVTFDKQPLRLGLIQFTSEESPPLPTGGALINNGSYLVPRAHGLLPGRYRVRIRSSDAAPAKPAVDSKLMRYETSGRECIPAEFNSASQQWVSVQAGEENRFDFQIP